MTQEQVAKRLGVSQAYLALLERGHRPVTENLGSKIAKLYGLGPIGLTPSTRDLADWPSSTLTVALGSVGYPGFSQFPGKPLHNPATILLAAITSKDLEVRVVEALPWLAIEYVNLDWEWLIREAKLRDVQNRLGFIVTLARRVAERQGNRAAMDRLRDVVKTLERSRLVQEDTLCQAGLPQAERRWLRHARTSDARHWNLLTDLRTEHLPYVA